MGIRELYAALVLSWGEDTAHGRWDEMCPDLNQCVPTALVTQDCLGGDLLQCHTIYGNKHVWNLLPNGREIDFTRAQFDYSLDYPVREGKKKANRKSLFRVKHVRRRYKTLRARVEAYLDVMG